MATNKEYSVLTYIVGDYEIVHEVEVPSPRAEYILVTDNPELSSSTWEVVVVDNPYSDPFGLCYDIRFNPFKYVHTDIVLRIDGSMRVCGDTDWLIDKFQHGHYDIALLPHPTRQTALEEYEAWVQYRRYDPSQRDKVLKALSTMGWDVKNDKGLYQYGVMIQRNNKVNNDINTITLFLLRALSSPNRAVERVDQVIGSVVVNAFDLKPLFIKQTDIFNHVLALCVHKTNNTIGVVKNRTKPFFHKTETEWPLYIA